MSRLMHEPFELRPWDWELCAEHRAEADELHARAKRDHEASMRLPVTDELLR